MTTYHKGVCQSGKRKFFDAVSAMARIGLMKKSLRRSKKTLSVYQCPFCSWYHLTHKSQRRKTGRNHETHIQV